MSATEDNWPRCIVCSAPFHRNRWWQRYCSPFCCTEFHRRERQQMRQWWKQSRANGVREIVDRVNAEIEAHEVPAQVEPLRRRL
jgi:hypothetical protein